MKITFERALEVLEAMGYELEQPEQEPVAWKDLTYGNLHHQDFGNSIPLYAAPVRTKDLTDDEILNVWIEHRYESLSEIARAVIAADRSKNGII